MNKPIRRLAGAGGGPSSPTIQEVSLITEDVVELNLGICEGPIAGLLRGPRSFYLDDTPLVSATGENNFDPFELHFFHGSDTPTPVRNVLGGLSNNTTIGVSLAEATPVVRLTSSASQGAVDVLELRFLINRLLKTNTGGDQLYNTLELQVHFREVGTQEWVEFFPGQSVVKVEGRIEGAVKEFRRVVPRIGNEWEIKVEKLNPDNDTFLFAEVTWESIQEVTNEVQSYENLAVVRGLSAASDQFSSFPQFSGVYGGRILKIPSNYDPVARYYSGVWDGTFKDGYTDNPAWCLYDMLTNPVYGAKAYYPELQVDRFSFYEAALWCDQLVPRGDGTTYQPRYTYNDLILEPRQGREQLQYMAGLFGGVLTQDYGGTVVLKLDKPGTIKQIFGPESVSVEGFQYQYTPVESRPNAMKVTFVNPDLGWEEDLREVEISAFVGANGRVTEDFVAVGCIDPFEAERRAMLRLLQANTEACSVSFKIARQALALDVLDLIGVVDPDQKWGLSGRIKSAVGTTINLRDPLLVPVDTDLTMDLQTPTGVVSLTVRSSTSNATSLNIVAGSVPNNLPDRAQFSLTDNGSQLGLVKPFRLLSVTEDDTDPSFFVVQAVEVNTNKWTDADNTTFTGEVSYTGAQTLKFEGVRASSGTEHLLKHSDGTIESRIFVNWNSTDLRGVKLRYRRKGQDVLGVIEAGGNSGVYVPGVQDGKDYELRLVGRTPKGKIVRSEWFRHTAVGKTAPPAAPTNLVGEGSFQAVSFSWSRNSEADFSHFEVYEGATVPEANTEGQKTTETNQVTFINVPTGGTKEIYVRAVDTTGNVSSWVGPVAASSVSLENTQPGVGAPTGLTLTTELTSNGQSVVTVTWDVVSGAVDYVLGISVGGSNEQTTVVAEPNHVISPPAGLACAVRVRSRNSVGSPSPWSNIETITAAVDTTPPAVPGTPTLTSGFNSIWIEWAGVADADLSHYEVHHRADNTAPGVSPTNIYRANATEMVDAGLSDNQTRYYAVRAVDTSGNKSGWSALVSATTLNPTMTEVTTEDIQGIVDKTSFAAGVTPVEIVGVLPTTGNFEGRQALLTTNGKTYRFHNGAWTNKIETADLSGLLSSAQIQSLETAKLTGTIGADLIAANAVTAKHLAVADFTNVNPDRNFAEQSLWTWGGSDQFFYQGTQSTWGSPWYMSIRSADGSFREGVGPAFLLDVNGGEYLLSSVCSNPENLGNAVARLQIADNAEFTNPLNPGGVNGNIVVDNATITRRTAVYSIPPGYTYGRIRYYLSGGATRGAFGGFTLRRMNNAELIVDGAISANHLTTDSVVAGKIAAGAVNAREIAAGAVTASKMLIADLTNLVPNGNVVDHDLTDYWEQFGGGEIRVLTNNPSYYETGNASLLLQKNGGNEAGSINAVSDYFLIDATKKLYAETAFKTNQTPTSNGAYFRILFYDADKNYINTYWDVANNRPMTTAWVKYSGEYQPPANAAFARAQLYNHSSQTTTNNLFVDRLIVRHMTAGELIVDGSIKAAHIGANEVIANTANIKNGVITSAKIAELDAGKLTAGTALTNSLTVDGRAIGSMSRSDNLFDDMTDLWSVVGGVGQFANTNSASNVVTGHNSQYARDEGNVWVESPHKIAYDPSKLYKVTFRVKRGGGTNGGRMYLGVVGYKADKVTRVNVSGSNTVSSSHYVVASSLDQDTMSSAFVEYTGYITGHAATGTHGNGTISNPGVANEYVRYIAPLAIFNYTLASGGRDMVVDSVKIEAIAEDDAAGLINSGSTQVDPGKILISGSTTLSDWRKGGDVTKIDGGKLSANTVSSNKITIGNRGITLIGIIFSTSGNVLSWTSGRIRYVGDSGSYTDRTISAGSVTYSGNWIYVYWQQGNGSFSTTTNPGTAIAENKVVIAQYRGGSYLDQNFGRTIIDGDYIKTGTIEAGHINTSSFNSSGLAVFGGVLKSSNHSAGSSGWRIKEDGSAEFNNLLVRGDLKVNSVSDGKDSYVSSGGKYINQTVDTLLYDTAVTPDTIFNCGFHCEYRGMGNWNTSSVTHTTLYLDVRELNGSTWSAWSRLFTSGSRTSTAWGKISGAYSRMFNADKVELRLYASMNATADNTINNVRRIGLVLRTIPRR